MRNVPLLLPLLSLSLAAQTPPPGPPPATGPAPALTANQGISPDDLVAVRATPYHPTLVRDPFAAPTDAEQTNKGDMVEDIGVKGRVVSNGKVLAVVTDARGNVRWLPIGFRFRNGELVSIEEKSVTFHQWDAATTNTKVYRTVVKAFKHEEGKR